MAVLPTIVGILLLYAKSSVTEEVQKPTILYTSPVVASNRVYLAEDCDTSGPDGQGPPPGWILSQAKKDDTDESITRYDGKWDVLGAVQHSLNNDRGLVLTTKAHHAATSVALSRQLDFTQLPSDGVVYIQYETNFQEGQECGGGYIKLLSHPAKLDLFNDKTPYSIMFGPDKCGNNVKIHFIVRLRNARTGSIREHHAKAVPIALKSALDTVFTDRRPHLFRLELWPTTSRYRITLDVATTLLEGSLLEDFSPPFVLPPTIPDPNEVKPTDWDDRANIPDPTATKPIDWDESAPETMPDPDATKPTDWDESVPLYIPDPKAVKPDDWDDSMDGEWEAPSIPNPKCKMDDNKEVTGCGPWARPVIKNPAYKGKWFAPTVDNPAYKGEWKAKMIANPEYVDISQPLVEGVAPVGAVGLELWSMSDQIYFDNFLVTTDPDMLLSWTESTFAKKLAKWAADGDPAPTVDDGSIASIFRRIINYSNQNPWIYAVYIVVLMLPIILVVSFCCSSPSSTDPSAQTSRVDAKKTDDATPDDQVDKVVSIDDEEAEELVPTPSDSEASIQTRSSVRQRRATRTD